MSNHICSFVLLIALGVSELRWTGGQVRAATIIHRSPNHHTTFLFLAHPRARRLSRQQHLRNRLQVGMNPNLSPKPRLTDPDNTLGYVSPYAASVAVSTVQPSRPSANTARNYSVPSSTASSSGSSISDTSPSTQYSYSQVPPRAFTLPTFRAMGDERTISPVSASHQDATRQMVRYVSP